MMKSYRLLQLGSCCLLAVMVGCGGTEVVNVDSSATKSSDGPSNSNRDVGRNEARPETDDRGSGADRSAGTSQSNSQSSNSSAVAAEPKPMIPDGSSSPTDPGDSTPMDKPEVDTVPPPSDYRVLLSDGGTIDIGDLLDAQIDEFDKRLETIAKGGIRFRTYYTPEAEQAANGNRTAPNNALNAQLTPGKKLVSGPKPVPGSKIVPGPKPVPGPKIVSDKAQTKPQRKDDLTFMDIGLSTPTKRRAATKRGPTAAYYRNGRPMIYVIYNRDSKKDETLISWDEAGRPLVIEKYSNGRRTGLRVLFRPRSDKDRTGVVVLVQEWRAGKLATTHVVAEDGTAETIAPADTPPTETNEQLVDRVAELDQFDKTLRENEGKLRKALVALNRKQNQTSKAARQQILQQLLSDIQAPDSWRR